ncbi:MAG TPA: hypothetical protein VF812_06830 [Ktedonobacterales bacterium]
MAIYHSGLGLDAFAANSGTSTGPASLVRGEAETHNAIGGACTLIVPANPLTAQGLATPYQLTGGAGCHEASGSQSAFVQAAALDPATGAISVYNPLVIDQGTQPAATPVVPTLPANAVVGIWFGSNGSGLRLQGAQLNTLNNAQCVNGLGSSIFGQMAYCNATTFFSSANQLIQAGKLTPPTLGTANDGLACPTVRDFAVVDQDQSDNVTATYRITQDGTMAQNTATTAAAFPGSVVLGNGSDNRLLSVALDHALGCTPWRAPDLANPGQVVPALPLDELQAAMYQKAPIALVPSHDPMTLIGAHANLAKQNLYRVGVDQPAETDVAQAVADQKAYCQNLLNVAPARLQLDESLTSAAPSLDPAAANSLFTFLATRLAFTFGSNGLNCTGLLNQPNPVHLVTSSSGVVTGATFTVPAQQTQAGA